MQLDLGIIRLDLIFELISGIIALMVTYYATKAYRLTGQKRLSDLSTGFLVLSAGMFGRVIGTWYFLAREPTEIILGIVTVAYGVSRIMAYILFVISTRPTYREPQAEETTGVTMLLMATFLVNTSLEVVAILVLVVVVLQAILNYLTTRSKFARYVLLGFFLLLVSHIMMAQVTTAPGLYLLSQGAQLLGFLSFLVMLYQAGRNE
jgi:ABC-type xylose transport system permease subunit